MINKDYLKIVFTEKYQFGTYKIKVSAVDKISGNTFTSETPIDLIAFSLPEMFESQEEAAEWLMGYYQNPTPVKAVRGVQALVQSDPRGVNESLHVLTFFRRVFMDNPFLFKNIANHFNFFGREDQKKFLLVSAISGDSTLQHVTPVEGEQELRKISKIAKAVKFPDVTGPITSGLQLDILWSEFLATGKYDPIKKIVGALVLEKYKGTLGKIKSGEIKVSKEVERQAYLEATYRSAVWSLISNCKQLPLVYKYCVFMYENENLEEDIKSQLGLILRIVQKEIQEEMESAS